MNLVDPQLTCGAHAQLKLVSVALQEMEEAPDLFDQHLLRKN